MKRVTPAQLPLDILLEGVEDGCDGEDADVEAYPLQGADRFRWLPLHLPPGFTFYLGTHHASDLARSDVPCFVSRRALVLDPAKKGTGPADWPMLDRQRKTLPRAVMPWAIDSAGFTELNQFACHHIPVRQYAAEVCRYAAEIGNLAFAAVQDWMCEPHVIAITKQSVDRHQKRTIESYMELVSIAPHIPWAPVLQGFEPGDHERHLALYYRNGIDLRCAPIVGVGSVCRRQGMTEADEIVRRLSGHHLRLHLFGYKFTGLPQTLHYARSADAMAWSMVARKQSIQMPGHDHSTAVTGELWQRGTTLAVIQRRDGVWMLRWDSRRRETDERVASKDAGRSALHAAGYTFVRSLWNCNNCFEWARLWRNNMLAIALGAARADTTVRRYGHQPFGKIALAEHRAVDPAEGWTFERDPHDYEAARESMTRLSGVRVPRAPQCRPPRSSGPKGAEAVSCVRARYTPPDAPPPTWAPPPRVAVETLEARGRHRAWRTWQPVEDAPGAAQPLSLFGAAPSLSSRLDAGRAASLAEIAARAVFNPGRLAGIPFDDASMLYGTHLHQIDDELPAVPSFQAFVTELRVLRAAEREAMVRVFVEAFEARLWELCVEDAPTDDARPENLSGAPWDELLGFRR